MSTVLSSPVPSVILTLFYSLVVVLGFLSMGFQLVANRLLTPYFGSSIIVWAWLISTFLAAFSIGSLAGGWVSRLDALRRFQLQIGSALLAVGSFAYTSKFGRASLDWIGDKYAFDSPNLGLCLSCVVLFFIPVTMLSSFGPQCVQYLALRGTPPGAASGLIYGISTVGNILGVMVTAFVLIPRAGVSTLLQVWLAVAFLSLGGLITLLRRATRPPVSP